MQVIKRDNRKVNFNREKIVNAILKAFKEVDGNVTEYATGKANNIATYIENKALENNKAFTVEEIQDLVENGLMSTKRKDVAKAYIKYRQKRSEARKNTIDDTIKGIIKADNEFYLTENANKNPRIASTMRDYIAGAVSRDMSDRFLLPKDVVEADRLGIIHYHDKDYEIQSIHNCDLINLDDMLQNGTVISETLIEKPHSFATACTITSQIIAQVASSQYGGQSFSLEHLAPFVDISRQRILKEVQLEASQFGNNDTSAINKIVETRLREEVSAGIQTIQYQLVTIQTTNGQAPFVTMFMYLNEARDEQTKKDLALLIEEVLKQRIRGVKNADGVWIAPSFPKLIYVTEEDNIREDGEYYYLTKLAVECSSKRLVPDYISEKVMKQLKGDIYPVMGCRSALTPDDGSCNKGNIANAKNYFEGQHKYYGRFNQGVVTLNLPDVAFSSQGDMDKFWKLLDERCELCHKALKHRHNHLMGTSTQTAPILWQHGAIARLGANETIDKLLYNNYSTISLGYCGLYECTKFMTHHSHSDRGVGEAFALKVMQYLTDKCSQWRAEENISYSIYGTPLESTTYKLAKTLKERFGNDIFIKLDGKDRNYVTNSYHIPVFEKINAFDKLKIESKFQALSAGGAISYIETPNMEKNTDALMNVVKYMYENIMYAEINTKSCYCEKCGYHGNIDVIDSNGKLVWHCPSCGNEDGSTMDIAFRVCGYIGTSKNGANQGRMGDIKDRVYHLDNLEV
jgi:ribonucleoside-triphosphate reductase